MSADLLAALTAAVGTGGVRVIDLTHTLRPEFPQLTLPPEFGQVQPFRIEEVARYDGRGPSWYWNNVSCGEHTGTHFDAPIHWVTGRDLANNSVDTIPPEHMIAPAVVLDFHAQSAVDPDFLLTEGHVREWESRHGEIPAGCWVVLRTDWGHREEPFDYQNYDDEGQHTPGPATDAVRYLVGKDVLGFGTETIGTDAGQAQHLNPPYPCHYFMHGSGKYGLQCLTNLDQLPPVGTVLLCAPLKIENGSGSPLRVLALVPGE